MNCNFFKRLISLSSFLLLLYATTCIFAQASETVWILVDTTKLRLEVKRENKTLLVFNNIAIGQNGAGFKKHKGDDITPIGSYKIASINKKSRFHKFYAFDYPSIENANKALQDGFLKEESYNAILLAHKYKQAPSQDTQIGGHIGIHGLGRASNKVHKILNWTHGCIALTNEQVNKLDRWITIGTVVKVK